MRTLEIHSANFKYVTYYYQLQSSCCSCTFGFQNLLHIYLKFVPNDKQQHFTPTSLSLVTTNLPSVNGFKFSIFRFYIYMRLLSICLSVSGFFFFWSFQGHTLGIWWFPGQGSEQKLQLLAYTTATTMLHPRHICELHHNSRQCWILNTLSEARNRTCILMDTSQIHFC